MEVKKVGHYSLIEEIGEGQFGKVWKAYKDDGEKKMYAIKFFKLSNFDIRQLGKIIDAEFYASQQLKHENILPMREMMKTEHSIYFVFDYCEYGSLTKYIGTQANHVIGESQAVVLLLQLVNCFKYLHLHNAVHRDIKPDNILLTKGFFAAIEPRIIDFGFAKIFEKCLLPLSDLKTDSYCCTPPYAAPEVLEGKPYNVQVDIYALGATYYFMLFGKEPFEGGSKEELLKAKLKGEIEFKVMYAPICKASIDFICLCLKLIDQRPHLKDISNHPLMRTKYEILAQDSYPQGTILKIDVNKYDTIY